jgi:hypothetical protein
MKTNELKELLEHDMSFRDACSRIKSAMDMHAVAGSSGYAAFKLEDGSTDNVAYETWNDAVRHQRWDRDNYMYLEITPDGMHSLLEAAAPLDFARFLRQQGMRIPSPEWVDHQAMSMPYQPWDRQRMARQLIAGKPLDPNGYSNIPSIRKK